jgi:hypothetical protein
MVMKTILFVICSVWATSGAFAQKKDQKFPLAHISQLGSVKADTIRLKGYIFDIYVCPPCPEGAQCKPCIENNFTVVEKKPSDPFKVRMDSRLRVFTERPDSLTVGKRYMLTVRFRNKKASPKDNLALISFKPL